MSMVNFLCVLYIAIQIRVGYIRAWVLNLKLNKDSIRTTLFSCLQSRSDINSHWHKSDSPCHIQGQCKGCIIDVLFYSYQHQHLTIIRLEHLIMDWLSTKQRNLSQLRKFNMTENFLFQNIYQAILNHFIRWNWLETKVNKKGTKIWFHYLKTMHKYLKLLYKYLITSNWPFNE